MDIFVKKLIDTIKNKLLGLFIEKHLYFFIYEFLYSSTKLLYVSNSKFLQIEIPIIGSNYMLLYDKTKIIKSDENQNILNITQAGEYIIEIIGDFESIDYKNYSYSNNHILKNSNKLYKKINTKKIIKYGINPELKFINTEFFLHQFH